LDDDDKDDDDDDDDADDDDDDYDYGITISLLLLRILGRLANRLSGLSFKGPGWRETYKLSHSI